MQLRNYQEVIIASARKHFSCGAKSVLVAAPCGAGKTVIFAELAKLSSAKGNPVGILVHRDSLLTQASRKLHDCGVEHGIIAPGYRSRGEMVQVASIQTLVRRLPRHTFKVLVADEAHHAISPTYSKIFQAYPDAKIIGVTATPCRTNGAGLDAVFQKMVLGPNIRELIDDGYLVEHIPYGPTHALDLSGVGTQAGDFDLKQLATHMDDPRITGDAVKKYSEVCPGVPAVAFACNIKHADDIAVAFRAAGYRAESVDGKMDMNLIRHRIAGLTDGSVQVLASCNLISEGTDIPDVVAAIMLRPTKSLSLFIQQGGRALRPVYAPGHDLITRSGRIAAIAASHKPRAIILDHAANAYRFMMTVDEPVAWSLEGRKKRKKGESIAIALRQCPKCAHTHKTAPKCPGCGYLYPIAPKDPEQVAGEMGEIDKAALRRAKWKEVAQARTIDALIELGKKRGYHPGWATHIMREREAKRDMFR